MGPCRCHHRISRRIFSGWFQPGTRMRGTVLSQTKQRQCLSTRDPIPARSPSTQPRWVKTVSGRLRQTTRRSMRLSRAIPPLVQMNGWRLPVSCMAKAIPSMLAARKLTQVPCRLAGAVWQIDPGKYGERCPLQPSLTAMIELRPDQTPSLEVARHVHVLRSCKSGLRLRAILKSVSTLRHIKAAKSGVSGRDISSRKGRSLREILR